MPVTLACSLPPESPVGRWCRGILRRGRARGKLRGFGGHRRRGRVLAGLARGLPLVALLGCGADDPPVLEPYGFAELGLLDFQSYPFALRYTTAAGLPIAAAGITCRVSGDGGGALLQRPFTQTDAEGLARFVLETRARAAFAVVCRPSARDEPRLSFTVRVG